MENKVNSTLMQTLLVEGTPQGRNEKSSFIRRSFGTLSTSKGDVNRNHDVSQNLTIINTSFLANSMPSVFGNNFESHVKMDTTEDLSVTAANILSDEDPGLYVVDSLYQEFMDVCQGYPGEHEVFELLFNYEGLCVNSIKQLLNFSKKTVPLQYKHDKIYTTVGMIKQERNCWRLLRSLYKDRLEVEAMNEEEMLMDTVGKRLSDKQIVENLYLHNSFVRQCQLVVDCLEKNAADDFYLDSDKLEFFSEHTASWEHTLHDLTLGSGLDRPTKGYLVTELDPDAPIRQRNSMLHDSDRDDEARLLKFMFLYVRAGNLEHAQRLAEKYGQPWLSAALEGWRLYHDPNYDISALADGGALQPIEGNKYRDIWKASCWRMSREPRISVYQHAIFGSLTGNLKAILPVCVTWEDYLWAYVKVLLDTYAEQEIRANSRIGRTLEELPPEYWDNIVDMKKIFQDIQASTSEAVRQQSQDFYHIIQKYIILDDIDGLIEQMYNWLHQKVQLSSCMKRFMAHLVLFLRTVGRSTKEELCISILEAYVKDLIENRKIPIVASYAAALPPAHQVIWYAKFLEGIYDNAERKLCLQYAEEAGLDVPLITKTVVENMRAVDTETIEHSDSNLVITITEVDLKKINAIDWLVFDPLQRSEAMKQANALIRVFIASNKLDAAREVFSKIPPDSIDIIMKQTTLKGHDELSADDDNATREYLCFKAYLEALDSFNDWFQHFKHAKPKPPEPPSGNNIKFKDRVAYEHELKQYELELERWENCLRAQTKTTTDRLYNVLLFVNGGWLIDQRTDGSADESRQKQMSLLRKICIPQITNILHSVLHTTGQYKESVQLADIISSERYQLYKEFNKSQLRNFLSIIRGSSLVLLDENLDPLGYPFQ